LFRHAINYSLILIIIIINNNNNNNNNNNSRYNHTDNVMFYIKSLY